MKFSFKRKNSSPDRQLDLTPIEKGEKMKMAELFPINIHVALCGWLVCCIVVLRPR